MCVAVCLYVCMCECVSCLCVVYLHFDALLSTWKFIQPEKADLTFAGVCGKVATMLGDIRDSFSKS